MIAPEKTYWDVVRGQFAKNRIAVWSLRLLAALFLLAIVAPVLCSSSPFYISLAENHPVAVEMRQAGHHVPRFPWFRDLFDHNRYPSGVDLFFNLLLAALLPGLVLWRVARGRRRLAFGAFGLLLIAVFVAMVLPGLPLNYSRPKIDYLGIRVPELDVLRADVKLPSIRRRHEEAQAAVARADARLAIADLPANERANAEANQLAAADTAENAERVIRKWEARRAAAAAMAEDPKFAYWMILPPIGYHHKDGDEERAVEDPTTAGGWGDWHLLGTDRNGRDVFALLLYGTRVSLTIGIVGVSIYCTIGTILGSLMGYFGRSVDMLGMRLVEIMMCFPQFVFILILVAVFNTQSIFLIMAAIGIIGWTGAARLIRGQFLSERGLDYVFAAHALGIPRRRIVFKHILPNAIHPIFVTATFGVASAILMESSLAFLGLGDPEVPSWGQVLLQGRETKEWWLIHSPGFAIFFTVTILNLVGEGLRDALDPKLRQ
ncbi:MAG TPA: ABC transporter permease [Planctomycetota bacterium]|nr:ABC transporter permease [Planctomycetota bacterium]